MFFDLSPFARELSRRAGGPLLALDASAFTASVAVASAAGLFERTLAANALPSEGLLGAVRAALAEADVRPAALAGIAVGLGPGSFTGLRVALALVKGLAFGYGTPVYGVSSLALLAQALGPGRVAVALDARRGDVYLALYEVSPALEVTASCEDHVCSLSEAAKLLALHGEALVTDLSPELLTPLAPRASVHTPVPRAAGALVLASARLLAGEGESLRAITPRYLRVSEAERALRR